MEKVNKMAVDPFQVIFFNDMDQGQQKDQEGENEKITKNETTLLDEAITKIATLLVLGFGEAGSFLVTKNLSQFGNVELKMKGNKTTAIFAFCDIRKFT